MNPVPAVACYGLEQNKELDLLVNRRRFRGAQKITRPGEGPPEAEAVGRTNPSTGDRQDRLPLRHLPPRRFTNTR